MESTVNINQLVREIEKLDFNDKISLISRIVNLLKPVEKPEQTCSVTQLKGLGKSIWQSTDIGSYISEERNSWD